MKRRIGIRVLRLAISRAVHTTQAMVAAFMLGTLAGLVLSRIERNRRPATAGKFTPAGNGNAPTGGPVTNAGDLVHTS